MRLAVLSDIHGNVAALEAVVADAEARGCDAFVNLGDIVSGPLWPGETVDFLMPRGWPTIAGNHERWVLGDLVEANTDGDRFAHMRLRPDQMAWLADLPPTCDYASDVFLCHGTPDDDMRPLLQNPAPGGQVDASAAEVASRLNGRAERLVLCGHTHIPNCLTLADGRTVANPGSVGLQAFPGDLGDFAAEQGSPHARYAIVEDLRVTLLTVAYDWEAAARKAEAEGEPLWAHALRTGRAR